jgi:hypothetical protein
MDESPDHEPTLIEQGMGVHLNHPIIAQRGIRNPRPDRWGLRKPHLRPAEGRRGSVQNKSESSPRSPRTGPGSGARRTATPPRVHRTQAMPVMCAWHRRGRLEYCRCRLKLTPRTLVDLAKKPCRSTHAPARLRRLDLRVRWRGPTDWHQQPGGRMSHQQASAFVES